MKNILVVDAQGGGLGAAIVKKLIETCGEKTRIVATGTNVAATSAMNKAGAKECATGENAVCFNARSADIIIGGIGIIAAQRHAGRDHTAHRPGHCREPPRRRSLFRYRAATSSSPALGIKASKRSSILQ